MSNLVKTPEKLKQSIIDDAMHGNITKHLITKESSVDLLKKIQNYNKTHISLINRLNIPFAIPKNWSWITLDSISKILEVPTIPKYKYTNSGIPFYRIKDVVSLSKHLQPNISAYISKSEYLKDTDKKGTVNKGDILITATATLGRTCIIKDTSPIYFQGSNNIIWIKNLYKLNPEFLNYIFQSSLFFKHIKDASEGSTIKHLSIKMLSKIPVPLPPLAEQHRIVQRLNEILPKVDDLNKDVVKLDQIRTKFPHRLKQSLLLEAMKGHLTQQLPSDGNADDLLQSIQQKKQQLIQAGKIRKHKKLPPISKDEIPFKIPKNWKWVRLLSLYDFIEGNPQKGYIKHKRKGYIRLYSVRDYNNNPRIIFIKKSKAKKMAHTGDLLLPKIGGSLGKIFIAHSGAYSANLADVVPIIKKTELNKNYLLYYLYSNFYQSFIGTLENKSAQAYFSNKDLLQLIIPIPPLSEQHRIVSKLHDLFDTINA